MADSFFTVAQICLGTGPKSYVLCFIFTMVGVLYN
ncbi:hypothetical protein S101174_00117 [Levilactobacillus brevis]|nr:hypothetical protein S101174_00117 [Levilactobacillus brevis]